jgi:hypothetical protein
MLENIIKSVRRIWLNYCLSCLIDQQTAIDHLMAEAEADLQKLRLEHKQQTDRLAAKRTSTRSELIRL